MDHASKATVCAPGGTAPAADANEPSPTPGKPDHVMVPSVAMSSCVFDPVLDPEKTLTADARDAARVKCVTIVTGARVSGHLYGFVDLIRSRALEAEWYLPKGPTAIVCVPLSVG